MRCNEKLRQLQKGGEMSKKEIQSRRRSPRVSGEHIEESVVGGNSTNSSKKGSSTTRSTRKQATKKATGRYEEDLGKKDGLVGSLEGIHIQGDRNSFPQGSKEKKKIQCGRKGGKSRKAGRREEREHVVTNLNPYLDESTYVHNTSLVPVATSRGKGKEK
eukprot:13999519-Ditylum_brightwellii.AAC.1